MGVDRNAGVDGDNSADRGDDDDRQHEADVAARPGRLPFRPDSPEAGWPRAPAKGEPGTGPRERQLAEHERYRRVVAAAHREAADQETGGQSGQDAQDARDQQGAQDAQDAQDQRDAQDAQDARGAWERAVPELRGAWEAHKQRYPDRERATAQTQPDGSWSGDGERRLSPEQNAEVSREYHRIREIGRLGIIPGLCAVEAAVPARSLAGFEHRFKGEDRLKEKIADQVRSTPGITPTKALGLIPDAVRFTLEYRDTDYTPGVIKDTERLEEEGFILVERRNTWASEQYKGINSRWREPDSGIVFEIQFHTQASLEAKELTHKAYERIRSTAKDPELAELRAFQKRVNSLVPIPPDVSDIANYPAEKPNG
jgi:hypothetical protein